MKKVFGLLCCLVAFAALAACGGTGTKSDDGGKCGGGDGAKCGTKEDPMMKMMYDNTKEAMFWVACHKNAEAGQYWEVKMTGPAGSTTEKWQIAAIVDGNPIVEQQTQWGFVIAYHVDTSKAEGEANVVKAWKGMANGKPEEIPVMAKPEPTGTAPANTDWTSETKSEPFTDVEMGGMKWSGTKTTTTSKHSNGKDWSEMVVWKADNAWFNGIIKSTTSGESSGYKYEMSSELAAAKTDGKPWLSWG